MIGFLAALLDNRHVLVDRINTYSDHVYKSYDIDDNVKRVIHMINSGEFEQ
jgi:hypothetical protein